MKVSSATISNGNRRGLNIKYAGSQSYCRTRTNPYEEILLREILRAGKYMNTVWNWRSERVKTLRTGRNIWEAEELDQQRTVAEIQRMRRFNGVDGNLNFRR